jgi:hypothetical protein
MAVLLVRPRPVGRGVVSGERPRGRGRKQIGDRGDGEPEAQAASGSRRPAAAKSAPPAMVSVTQLVLIIGGTSFRVDGSSQS